MKEETTGMPYNIQKTIDEFREKITVTAPILDKFEKASIVHACEEALTSQAQMMADIVEDERQKIPQENDINLINIVGKEKTKEIINVICQKNELISSILTSYKESGLIK